MFFTSGILIAFFCFAFYLIWNQFLKKDTRLSTGLQVLRRKITDLENLSLTVSAQVDRQLPLVNNKAKELEILLQNARAVCDRLEKNIKAVQALENSSPAGENQPVGKNVQTSPPIRMEDPALQNPTSFVEAKESPSTKSASDKPSSHSPHLKMVKTQSSHKKKKMHFGESPFTNIDFIDSP